MILDDSDTSSPDPNRPQYRSVVYVYILDICCFAEPGSASGDQQTLHTGTGTLGTQSGEMETSATSSEYSDQLMPQQPLDVHTNTSDPEGTVSLACTRTRTVKTPKHYDV